MLLTVPSVILLTLIIFAAIVAILAVLALLGFIKARGNVVANTPSKTDPAEPNTPLHDGEESEKKGNE